MELLQGGVGESFAKAQRIVVWRQEPFGVQGTRAGTQQPLNMNRRPHIPKLVSPQRSAIEPFDGLRARVAPAPFAALLLACLGLATQEIRAGTAIARVWNEQNLAAIRIDSPHPPVQARNLFSVATCMYDAWTAYDTHSVGYIYHQRHSAPDIYMARRAAISQAAWRMLRERYAHSRSATTTLANLDAQMLGLGFATNNFSTDPSTPIGVGNAVYEAVSAWFLNDGARQTNETGIAYADALPENGGYVYTNPILLAGVPGITIVDINRWQRLQILNATDQNGFPVGPVQTYQGPQWLHVRPFAVSRQDPTRPWIDPGPPPRLGTASDHAFRTNVIEVIRASAMLTPDDGFLMDISPGAFGNNPLGSNDGTGHPSNPYTGLAYPPNVVKRGDVARLIAEFWADGPSSETPPGHWNVIANKVSDHPLFQKRLQGQGPVLDDLEWEVKLYFAINAAVHEGACAAWAIKRYYDSWRPISAIRYQGSLGQCSDPSAPSYHTNGLPLITNLIEIVTAQTSAFGGRHSGLKPGKVAVRAWPGQPVAPSLQYSGVKWIHADAWVPYQRSTFVTPGFPGYISGHSTFSRSAAEVMVAITGSPFFPGGILTQDSPANTSLGFEKGPSQAVQLQWATYYDAADQAGLSRIWGGIHPPVDDFAGRRAGSACGIAVWELVLKYLDGSIARQSISLAQIPSTNNTRHIRFNTVRGFRYSLQSTPDLATPFAPVEAASIRAEDTSSTWHEPATTPQLFYRVLGESLTPLNTPANPQ